jgi:hypothetical protein
VHPDDSILYYRSGDMPDTTLKISDTLIAGGIINCEMTIPATSIVDELLVLYGYTTVDWYILP